MNSDCIEQVRDVPCNPDHGNSVSPMGNGQKSPPEDGDIGSGIGQGIGRLRASIALSQALSRGDC